MADDSAPDASAGMPSSTISATPCRPINAEINAVTVVFNAVAPGRCPYTASRLGAMSDARETRPLDSLATRSTVAPRPLLLVSRLAWPLGTPWRGGKWEPVFLWELAERGLEARRRQLRVTICGRRKWVRVSARSRIRLISGGHRRYPCGSCPRRIFLR